MIINATKKQYDATIQHAFFMQQKARILFAFTATMFFLCIENVKAFTAPLCNPDCLIVMASGAHSIAKKWTSKPGALSTRHTSQGQTASDYNSSKAEQQQLRQSVQPQQMLTRSQRNSLTTLNMAFSFAAPSTYVKEEPPTLDMKTSINAFGSWYNKMDPVARPPDYDDDETDYTISSPADNWPSSFDEEHVISSTAAFSMQSRGNKNISSNPPRRPRPIRTIRKIAGWFLGSSSGRLARGFGSQTLL